MSASINGSWTAAPSPVSGTVGAAPYVRSSAPTQQPTFTVNGLTVAEAKAKAAEAQRQQLAHQRTDGYATQAQTEAAYRQFVKALGERDDLSDIGRAQALEAWANGPDAQAARQAADDGKERARLADERAQAVRAGMVAPTDALGEDRKVKRFERQLDSADNFTQTAHKLVQDANEADLSAVLEAVENHGESTDGWLDATLAAKVPDYAAACAEAQRAAQEAAVLAHNDDKLRRSYATGTAPATPLVNPSVLGR